MCGIMAEWCNEIMATKHWLVRLQSADIAAATPRVLVRPVIILIRTLQQHTHMYYNLAQTMQHNRDSQQTPLPIFSGKPIFIILL